MGIFNVLAIALSFMASFGCVPNVTPEQSALLETRVLEAETGRLKAQAVRDSAEIKALEIEMKKLESLRKKIIAEIEIIHVETNKIKAQGHKDFLEKKDKLSQETGFLYEEEENLKAQSAKISEELRLLELRREWSRLNGGENKE